MLFSKEYSTQLYVTNNRTACCHRMMRMRRAVQRMVSHDLDLISQHSGDVSRWTTRIWDPIYRNIERVNRAWRPVEIINSHMPNQQNMCILLRIYSRGEVTLRLHTHVCAILCAWGRAPFRLHVLASMRAEVLHLALKLHSLGSRVSARWGYTRVRVRWGYGTWEKNLFGANGQI